MLAFKGRKTSRHINFGMPDLVPLNESKPNARLSDRPLPTIPTGATTPNSTPNSTPSSTEATTPTTPPSTTPSVPTIKVQPSSESISNYPPRSSLAPSQPVYR